MKIVAKFGDWYIRPSGIYHKGMDYWIHKERLNEPDWLSHMNGKSWINMIDFWAAYYFALDYWKVKVICK